MAAWEYLRVMWIGHGYMASYGGASENVLVSVSDGRLGGDAKNSIKLQEKRETKMPIQELDRLLNQLGVEGWEMVNCYGAPIAPGEGTTFGHFAFFKRPKA